MYFQGHIITHIPYYIKVAGRWQCEMANAQCNGRCISWEKKQERSPETIRKNQIRGTWLVSLFIAFAILSAFIEDEENADLSNDETGETVSAESRSSGAATDVSKLGKPKSFREITVDKWKVKLLGDDTFRMDADNGTAFFHSGLGKKVISVDDDGVIIGQQNAISGEWQVVYVKTADSGYKEY